jgi:hypothetical protein
MDIGLGAEAKGQVFEKKIDPSTLQVLHNAGH